MTWLKRVALILSFFLDIHVKANSSLPSEALACIQVEKACLVEAQKSRKVVSSDDIKLVLGQDSLLQKISSSEIRLLRGRCLAEVSGEIKVQSPFAQLNCESDCIGIIDRHSEALQLRAIKGDWTVKRRGDKQPYVVKAGTQILIGEISIHGHADMDFPQSLPLATTLSDWASLHEGDVESFREKVLDLRPAWKESLEELTVTQQIVAKREIAADLKVKESERQRALAVERETESLKDLFRQKNYLNP